MEVIIMKKLNKTFIAPIVAGSLIISLTLVLTAWLKTNMVGGT